MAKLSMVVLAERMAVMQSQIDGLQSQINAQRVDTRPASYVPKTVQPEMVKVTCAKLACHTKGTVPWEDRIGWKCPEHDH